MSESSQAWIHHRAQIARLTQSYPPDHPKIISARQNFLSARLEYQLTAGINDGVTLTDSQVRRLVSLLIGGQADAA